MSACGYGDVMGFLALVLSAITWPVVLVRTLKRDWTIVPLAIPPGVLGTWLITPGMMVSFYAFVLTGNLWYCAPMVGFGMWGGSVARDFLGED